MKMKFKPESILLELEMIKWRNKYHSLKLYSAETISCQLLLALCSRFTFNFQDITLCYFTQMLSCQKLIIQAVKVQLLLVASTLGLQFSAYLFLEVRIYNLINLQLLEERPCLYGDHSEWRASMLAQEFAITTLIRVKLQKIWQFSS